MSDPADDPAEDDGVCPICGAPLTRQHLADAHPTTFAAAREAAQRGRAERTPDQW